MSQLRVLDLFSGIGGFSLGLERTGGFKTVAFCEIEPFPRRVLAKHWPEVPCYDDVRTLTADRLRADGVAVDAICGGFPCQDLSYAGLGAGIMEGTRSGLWSEITRLASDLRPFLIIVENVAALLSRGLDRVLRDLAALRYDAEWHCIPASALGAPHRRDRFWLVAYAKSDGRQVGRDWNKGRNDNSQGEIGVRAQSGRDSSGASPQSMADADRAQRSRLSWGAQAQIALSGVGCRDVADAYGIRCGQVEQSVAEGQESEGAASSIEYSCQPRGGEWWGAEPDVGRVAHGVPSRVDRLKGLGNAVVPQIPELIGNAILASLAEREAA